MEEFEEEIDEDAFVDNNSSRGRGRPAKRRRVAGKKGEEEEAEDGDEEEEEGRDMEVEEEQDGGRQPMEHVGGQPSAKKDPQERVRKEWEDGPEAVAEAGLSSLSLAFGSQTTVPICMKWVNLFIRCEDDWKYRYAALMCLFAIIEGCEREFSRDARYVTHLIVDRMSDPHPRVRYAACGCIAQLSLNLKRGSLPFQAQYHGLVIPALLAAVQDVSPHVQERSCQALVNVMEEEMAEILQPFSEGERESIMRVWDELLEKLLDLTRSENKRIKQAAIIAVAAMADSLKEKFAKYYERFAPVCLDILRRERPAVTARDKKLAARALECITQMALSVGPTPVNKYAKEVVEILQSSSPFAQQLRTESSTFVSAAIGRISLCMGLEFLPHLPYFFAHLERATMTGNEIISDPSSLDPMFGGWGMHRRNERVLEDKLLAVKTLFTILNEYAETEQGAIGYFPFAARTFGIIQEVLHGSLDQECHIFAPTCFPPLVTLYKRVLEWRVKNGQVEAKNRKRKERQEVVDADHEAFLLPDNPLPSTVSKLTERSLDSLMANIWRSLLDLLSKYGEPDVIDETLQSMSACLNAVGEACLSPADVAHTISAVFRAVDESGERLQNLREELGPDDDEALVASQEKEHRVNNAAEWLFSDLIKNHWPLFDEASVRGVVQEASTLATAYNAEFKRTQTTGVCVLADIIDLIPDSKEYVPLCLRTFMSFIDEKDSRLLQAAVYAIGACAEKGEADVALTLTNDALPNLVRRIEAHKTHGHGIEVALDEAIDNAISAVGKICFFHAWKHLSESQLATLAQKFVDWLPLSADVIEMVAVCNLLCLFLESPEERLRRAVLGPNGERRQKVVGLLEEQLRDENELGRKRLRTELEHLGKVRGRFERVLADLKSTTA